MWELTQRASRDVLKKIVGRDPTPVMFGTAQVGDVPRPVQMFKNEQRSLSVRPSIRLDAGASTPGHTRVVAEPAAGILR